MSEMVHPHVQSHNVYGSNFHLTTRVLTVIAGLTSLFYVAFEIGELYHASQANVAANTTDIYLLIGFSVALAGLILSWFWQRIAGIVTFIAGIFITTLIFSTPGVSRYIAVLLYGSPFLITGVLIFVDAIREQKLRYARPKM